MTAELSAELRYSTGETADGESALYQVLMSGEEPRRFAEEDEAIAWAEQTLRAKAEQRLREQGAPGEIHFTTNTDSVCAGDFKVSTRITVCATT